MRNGILVGWVLAAVVMLVGMALGGCAGWEVGSLPTVESVEHEKARAEELLVRVREARAGSEVAAADDGLTESERGRLLGEAERARSAEKVMAQTVVNRLSPPLQPMVKPHRHANFAVLRAPEIPSVLVEMGFLSNVEDE